MKRFVALCSLFLAALGTSACNPDLRATVAEARYTSPASQFVTTRAGLRVHVRDEGKPDAPVLILAHGSNASLHTWEPWVGQLKANWRIISFDFPGHGLTGPSPDGIYSTTSYVQVVDDLADYFKLDRFVLGGNSMGGGVAWRYGLAHPEKLAGLILVDAAGYPRDTGKPPLVFRLARTPGVGEVFSRFTTRGMIEANLKQVIVDDALVTDQMVTRYHDLLMREGNRQATLTRMRAGPDAPNAHQQIPTIKVPTLVIWGEADPWIPLADGQRFAREIAGAKLVTYPNIGHLPQEEVPVQSAGEVEAFLRQIYGVSQP